MSKAESRKNAETGSAGKGSEEDVARKISPSYYSSRSVGSPFHEGIECYDSMIAALGNEGFMDYCAGCAIKYIWRYKQKNGLEDIAKAMVYLEFITQMLTAERSDGKPV